jgi:hypothetical protein
MVFQGLVDSTDSSKRQAILRGAVAALYAHWEGFVKNASQKYLDFVKVRRLRLCDLDSCFVALAFGKKQAALRATSKSESQLEFVDWLIREWPLRANLPGSEVITTHGNLNAEVFRTIVSTIGLAYRPDYALAEKRIGRLVEIRNNLAHGEWQIVDVAEYQELYREIDQMVVLFCNDVDAAASTSRYKRGTTPAENVALIA